ncbi:MAG: MBOAT family O-acyltransferase [Bacteroidota bacterium]
MLFNSIEFVWFLPAVVLLYYLVPGRFRWILLLLASYTFYMFWKVEYAALIAASTLVDFFAGGQMGRCKTRRARLPFLILSLGSNLGLLFAFKYANFFSGTVNEFFATDLPQLDLLLPVGISFYTFQTLSYSIDVYRGRQAAETHLGHFAVYVAFFPQLVAGPIERFSRLGPQLRAQPAFAYENFAHGFRLLLYGFFVKMVVADNLAGFVNAVYEAPADFGSSTIVLALFLYALQIYGDFYGYSLIAIGSARLLGIRLMDNFHTPYLSVSVADFWQRWHISLSTWFRDYLYIPLGGNRVALPRWSVNILLVFTISGLWHGASWTFVLWGALWGMAYLIEKLLGKIIALPEIRPWSAWHFVHALKMFGIATLAWLPFRSADVGQMKAVLKGIRDNLDVADDLALAVPGFVCLLFFLFSDGLLYNRRFDVWIGDRPFWLRWTVYAALIFAVLVFAAVEEFPFIYFQF